MAAPDAICPILITPFHTTKAQLTVQRAVHAWVKHACTFINHRWVCSTSLSSMMSPGGVGSVFTGTGHPQDRSTFKAVLKLCKIIVICIKFAKSYLIPTWFLCARKCDVAQASLFPVMCAL